MAISWYEKVKEFKSPTHVVAAILLRSRETHAANNRQLAEEVEKLNAQLDQQAQQRQQQQEEIAALRRQVAELQKERDEARRSVNLPEDPPLGTHGFGARMISLAVNVARSVGLRGAARVLRLFFDWLGVRKNTPTRSAIQQTELAHLTPPSPKQKARFMNLASTIRWMTMIVWLLRNPDAAAREGISEERMQDKLGCPRVGFREGFFRVISRCLVKRSRALRGRNSMRDNRAEGAPKVHRAFGYLRLEARFYGR